MLRATLKELEARCSSAEKPEWVLRLPWTLHDFVIQHGIRADGHPIEFERHSYLKEIYERVRFDGGESFALCMMSGAQVGKSILALSTLIYAALRFSGDKLGYFLPDREMADIFSSDRYVPMVEGNPRLRQLSQEAGVQEDRKRLRKIGTTSIFFSYMRGRTSTESIPMRGVFFDEVRRMSLQDIERAEERVSHSDYPLYGYYSTAHYPNSDIDRIFRRSTQHVWHSFCHCPEGVALAELWPTCVGYRGHDGLQYRCPRCNAWIENPRHGRFVARNPESPTIGFHVPQIVSPVMPLSRLWDKWSKSTDKKEFWNSALGLPYLDPDSVLVTQDVALACVDPSLRWDVTGEYTMNAVMGVDQRSGELHVCIAERTRGKLAIRWVGILQDEIDPFQSLYPLMNKYDVSCAVIDALPNYHDAVRFASAFKGRVFLSYYSDHRHMVRWSDRDPELRQLRSAEGNTKWQYHCMLDRYKAIEWALMLWVNREVAMPDPSGLLQSIRVRGVKQPVHVAMGNSETGQPGLIWHLGSIARRSVPVLRSDATRHERIETGEMRMVWENISIDPHFVHAWTYCAIASARRPPVTEIIIPERSALGAKTENPDIAQIEERVMPTIPQTKLPSGVCASCVSFDREGSRCTLRFFTTAASAPACHLYEEIDESEDYQDEH